MSGLRVPITHSTLEEGRCNFRLIRVEAISVLASGLSRVLIQLRAGLVKAFGLTSLQCCSGIIEYSGLNTVTPVYLVTIMLLEVIQNNRGRATLAARVTCNGQGLEHEAGTLRRMRLSAIN